MTYVRDIKGSLYGPFYKTCSKTGDDGKYAVDYKGQRVLNWNNYTAEMSDNTSTPSVYGYYIAGGQPAWNQPLIKSVATLQNKLVNKIKDHQFNLGVALGESRQTLTMIRDNVCAIGLAARDVRRGRFNDALRRLGSQFEVNEIYVGKKRREAVHIRNGMKFSDSPRPLSSKDFGNRWIEIQYGWLPLLSDVNEAANALRALEAPRKSLLRVGTNDHSTYQASQSYTLWNIPGVWRCKQSLYYEFRENLSVSRSLSLDDPYSVAWELLPWSFVIDWFIPIGSFIENLNQIPRLTGRSMRVKWMKWEFHSQGAISNMYYRGATTVGSGIQIERVCTQHGVPLALPQFKTLDKALSPMHLYNALALARQHFPPESSNNPLRKVEVVLI